jgi:superfamily II DNA or RNA helicase
MQLMICGDNDYLSPGNPGRTHATVAATAYNAILAIPDDDADWNDMAKRLGMAAVASSLEKIMKAAQPAPPVEEVINTYDLRPYQRRLIYDVRKTIKDGFRSILVASPTGSGKSVMLTYLIKLCHEKGSSVLFMVHRKEILFQIADYLDFYGIKYGLIKSGEKHEDGHPIQLAMFQTIARRLKNPYIKQADVIIVDECHHATAETFLKSIETFRKPGGILLGFGEIIRKGTKKVVKMPSSEEKADWFRQLKRYCLDRGHSLCC